MNKLEKILPDNLNNLWNEYVELWQTQRRKEASTTLEIFMKELSNYSERLRNRIAKECCKQAFKASNTNFPFQAILLKDLIVPYLVSGLHHNKMPEILWLVEASIKGFSNFIKDRIGNRSNIELLELAVKIKPNCKRAWQLLLKLNLSFLDYAAHELPDCWVVDIDTVHESVNSINIILSKYPRLMNKDMKATYTNILFIYNMWVQYSATNSDILFPDWCKLHHINW